MDNDLKVLKHFEDGSANRLYFSDLWHIFRSGEEVITSQNLRQAYRVLHVSSGRPYLSPLQGNDKDEAEDDHNVFGKSYIIPDKSSAFVSTATMWVLMAIVWTHCTAIRYSELR